MLITLKDSKIIITLLVVSPLRTKNTLIKVNNRRENKLDSISNGFSDDFNHYITK